MRVLITGASSGIGESTARAFSTAGHAVALLSEQEESLQDVAASLRAGGGEAEAFPVNLARPAELVDLLPRIDARFGPLDVLINNAGVGMDASVLQADIQKIRMLFEVNFFALAELSRQALQIMGDRRRGRIINVSSAAGLFGSANISAYSASKGAVHAFTQALRIEASALNVRVSEVLPISVRTRFFDNAIGGTYRPQGIVMTPESVAQSILRCAQSRRANPEVLPFPGIRALLILNAQFPAMVSAILCRRYRRSIDKRSAAS